MKITKNLGRAGFAAALMAATPALAQSTDTHLYVRADVGQSFSDKTGGDIFHGNGFGNDFGDTQMADFGGGIMLPKWIDGVNLRTELNIGYRTPRFGDHSAPNTTGTTILSTQTKINTWTMLVNAFADFSTGTDFTPYVGFGVGGAFHHLGTLNYKFNGTQSATEPGTDTGNFAWQGMAGIAYALTPWTSLDLGYHYLDAGKVRSSGAVTLSNGVTSNQPPVQSNLRAHEVTLGVRFAF